MKTTQHFLRQAWFEVDAFQIEQVPEGCSITWCPSTLDRLCFVAQGNGSLQQDCDPLPLCEGDLVILPSHAEARWDGLMPAGMVLYRFDFSCVEIHRALSGEWTATPCRFPLEGHVRPVARTVVRHLIDKIQEQVQAGIGVCQAGREAYWHELLSMMLQHAAEEPRPESYRPKPELSILETASYMAEHLEEEFQVNRMAVDSGLGVTQFYKLFKEYLGVTPLQWLTHHRIRRSRELIASSELKIAEIAHAVGYADEYYFSRLFKKHNGLAPSEFLAGARRKIAVLAKGVEESLLALGITPCLTIPDVPSSSDRPFKGRFAADLIKQLHLIKPDLILAPPTARPILDRMSAIAPVRLIEDRGATWRELLVRVAESIDLRALAFAWLDTYDSRALHVGQQVQKALQADSVLLVQALPDERYRVYGARSNGIIRSLYEELNVRLPDRVRNISQVETVNWQDLDDFDADRIVLLADSVPEVADVVSLHQKNGMQGLRAQLSDKLYVTAPSPWIHPSAWGHEQLLEAVMQLWVYPSGNEKRPAQ